MPGPTSGCLPQAGLAGAQVFDKRHLWYKARPFFSNQIHTRIRHMCAGCLLTAEVARLPHGAHGGSTRTRRFRWPACPCDRCWKPASISDTRPASGTRRWRRSSSATATGSTSSTSRRRCRCTWRPSNFVKHVVGRQAARILFVGTKRSARDAVREEAARCGMPYVEPPLARRHAHQLQDHPAVDQAARTSSTRWPETARSSSCSKKEGADAAPRDGEARAQPRRHQGHGRAARRAVRHRRRPREDRHHTRPASSASRWSASSTPTAARTASTT